MYLNIKVCIVTKIMLICIEIIRVLLVFIYKNLTLLYLTRIFLVNIFLFLLEAFTR